MKAIILAAGIGSRMSPLTNSTHKSLVNINGVPIINQMIDSLIHNGITDIVVVLGYLNQIVSTHLTTTYSEIDFTFIINKNYAVTNNIHSLDLAFDVLGDMSDDILLLECDLVYDRKLISMLLESRHKNIALVDDHSIGMDGTVVEINDDNKIIDIIQSKRQGTDFNYSNKYKTLNIYKFSKEFCNNSFKKFLNFYSETFDNKCFYESILSMITFMDLDDTYALNISGIKWIEIDTLNDLERAEYMFEIDNRADIIYNNFGGRWNFEYLDFNLVHNHEFPNGQFIAEIKNNIEQLMTSYGTRQIVLNKKMSRLINKDERLVRFLNGVSQIYPILENIFSNKVVAMPHNTFGEYYRLGTRQLFYNSLNDIDYNADVLCIINPNNPTGYLETRDIIIDNINQFEYIIVDESFMEFASTDESIINLVITHNNIIYLKSLGKCWGLPGIRMGYVYTSNLDILNKIDDAIPIWNANSIAEYVLEIMPRYLPILSDSYKRVKQQRQLMIESLDDILTSANIEHTIYNSDGNYFMCDIPEHSNMLYDYLIKTHNILIKKLPNNYIRIAIQSEPNNLKLMLAIRDYIWQL